MVVDVVVEEVVPEGGGGDCVNEQAFHLYSTLYQQQLSVTLLRL